MANVATKPGGFGLDFRIDGVAETIAQLKGLPEKLRRAIVRKAMDKATKPVLMSARANARRVKDTGLLARSISRKTKTYKKSESDWAIVAVIGPRRGMKQQVTRRGRSKPSPADPVNYAHLVEYGTLSHSLDKGQRAPRDKETLSNRVARTSRAAAGIQKRAQATQQAMQQTKSAAKREILAQKLAKEQALLQTVQKRLADRQRMQARTDDFTPTGRRIHKGSKAQPFLRKAFEANRQVSREAFVESVREELQKILSGAGTKKQKRALAGL